MSRNKLLRFTACIAASALCASLVIGLRTDHIAYANEPSAYKTTTLTYSDLIITATTKISTEYPTYVNVSYDAHYSSATFVRYIVDGGTFVNEGDPLIEISASINEIDLMEVKMDLDRVQKEYDAYLSEAANALELARDQVAQAADDTAKRIAQLSLEKLTLQQQRNKENYQSRLQDLKDRVAAYEAESITTTINAPTTGEVIFPTHSEWRLHTGDSINSSTYFGTIYEHDTSIFVIEGASSIFRYGMELTLTDRDGNTYPAHVVNCSGAALSSTLRSEQVYILPDVEIPATYYVDLVASYESIHMEHIIKVPAGSYHNDSNGSFVYLVTENGGMMKQYFTRGRTLNDCCVAIDGLTEGMVIVTK